MELLNFNYWNTTYLMTLQSYLWVLPQLLINHVVATCISWMIRINSDGRIYDIYTIHVCKYIDFFKLIFPFQVICFTCFSHILVYCTPAHQKDPKIYASTSSTSYLLHIHILHRLSEYIIYAMKWLMISQTKVKTNLYNSIFVLMRHLVLVLGLIEFAHTENIKC